MRNVFFIAWQDFRHQMRQGSTLLWLFLMPPIFFYFIGTATGGFSSGISGGQPTPLLVVAEQPGFMREQIDRRLRDNAFAPEWVTSHAAAPDATRTLTLSHEFSLALQANEQVSAEYDTQANALRRNYETLRIQRSMYTVLADVVVSRATNAEGELQAASLAALNAEPRLWQLDSRPAGERRKIPTGFGQAVPGILVMFTLLILLTTGATMLVLERQQGLLRRLASAPVSRTEVVAGKWTTRMLLAIVQIGVALVIGMLLFRMRLGPDAAMVLLVLLAWGGFCASMGLLLGTLLRTEGQASAAGVLLANMLAALGGCWWPIEITPGWMQTLQNFLPTGWAMDALHRLISFQSGWASALPQLLLLLLAAIIVAGIAVRRFSYQSD